jgi:hypothetical protein
MLRLQNWIMGIQCMSVHLGGRVWKAEYSTEILFTLQVK